MRTIAEMLRWRARRHPALRGRLVRRQSQSYGELDAASSQLAAGLVDKLGLAPGDRVAIIDKNSAAISNCSSRSTKPAWSRRR